MYQLLIVDDEEDIRRGMAKGIPWADWGFEVSGQAGNGQEAVALVEQQRPDVVLTDIRMPRMDGIELMQYLHEQYPEVKIIILSGYNDVEYLKLAIKNQVTEYLLKPTDIDEFEALFHRLRERLDEEREQRSQMEAAKQTIVQNQELSYGRLLGNLLDGYVGGEAERRWKAELEEAGIDFNSCVLVVFDTGMPEREEADSHYQLRQQAVRYCNSREDGRAKRFFLYYDARSLPERARPQGMQYGVPARADYDARSLPERARPQGMQYGVPARADYDAQGVQYGTPEGTDHHDKIVGIITVPGTGEDTGSEAACYAEELKSEASDICGLPLVLGISRRCLDERQLPQCYEEAMAKVRAMQDQAIPSSGTSVTPEPVPSGSDVSEGQKKGSLLVNSVKEYLDGQYCSNAVSLEAVAEHFRKNPAYISKVFKKETGFNFSDYITQKRMEKSKELLRDMSLKIYEIAQMTGYADASNFIKVFKKHCGMSPNEYRSVI